jgi:AcrR family transcriptional regulator
VESGQKSTKRAAPVRAAAVAQRAEATREALITAARSLFVIKGYFGTNTEEIVVEAGVGTRGALYHHFPDKKALFQAVLERVEEDLLSSAATLDLAGDALARLRSGLLGFLEASMTPEVQRILLIDGPAVLGWSQWRAIEQQFGLGAIQQLLLAAMAEGALQPVPADALAHILLAAVDEAALFIAGADDKVAAKDEAIAAMDLLLGGLGRGSRTD